MDVQNIQPVSFFVNDPDRAIKLIQEGGKPLVLTRDGKAAAVLVSPEAWDAQQNSMAMQALLSERLLEVRQGKTLSHDEGMAKVRAQRKARRGK